MKGIQLSHHLPLPWFPSFVWPLLCSAVVPPMRLAAPSHVSVD
jgi:hypothetical protein